MFVPSANCGDSPAQSNAGRVIKPPPPAPEFPSTAEAMALAVLAGDLVAARALADWIADHT